MDRSFASHFVLPKNQPCWAVLVDHPQSAHGPNHIKPKSSWTRPRFSYAFARALDGKLNSSFERPSELCPHFPKVSCVFCFTVTDPNQHCAFLLTRSKRALMNVYIYMYIIARKPTVSSQASSTSRRPTCTSLVRTVCVANFTTVGLYVGFACARAGELQPT